MRSAARSIRSWYCSYISANNARSPSLSNTDKKHESIRYYPTLQPCEHSTTTTCVFLPASHHVSISLWTLFKKQSLHQSRVYQKSLYTNELSRTVCLPISASTISRPPKAGRSADETAQKYETATGRNHARVISDARTVSPPFGCSVRRVCRG